MSEVLPINIYNPQAVVELADYYLHKIKICLENGVSLSQNDLEGIKNIIEFIKTEIEIS